MIKNFAFGCYGKPWTLNGFLIETKSIYEDTCHVIADLHREKQSYILEMEKCEPIEIAHLHKLYEKICNTEFRLQDAWGFVRDSNWHRHWRVPHCVCPTGINRMAYPHHSFYTDECPVHGKIDVAIQSLRIKELLNQRSIYDPVASLYHSIISWLKNIKK